MAEERQPRTRRQPRAKRLAAKRALVAEARALIEGVQELFASPARFARRAYALDSRGRSVAVDDRRAARFCLAGVLLRAEHDLHGTPIPMRTTETVDEDDIFLSPVPPEAPGRLVVALSALAMASGYLLQSHGVRFRYVEAEEKARFATTLHRPILLSLHPRAGFCERRGARMSLRAAAFTTWALALLRVGGGAILLAVLGAPSWAVAGWLLPNVRMRLQLPVQGERSR